MSYQVTTKTSYGKRLGNSARGVFTGLLLFVAATALLWWNEGRAVQTSRMLNKAGKECVDVADVNSVDPSLNGKLIHAVAIAQTDQTLSDPDFPVSVKAVKLERSVEYYQWVETSSSTTKDKVGGGQETVTTYDYHRAWVSSPVNSGSFADPAYKDKNSVKRTVDDFNMVAKDVSFGGYRLPASLINSIPCDTPVELPAEMAKDSTVHVSQNVLYYGANPSSPEVGDVRVTFKKGLGGEASILAQVNGDSFESFEAKGKSLCTLKMGNHSMDSMFESAKAANKGLLWILRILGIILVIGALRCMFSLLVTVFKVLPFLAKVVNLGVNLVTSVIGVAWSLIVILVAWVAYRPFLAVVLLIAACGLVYWLAQKGKNAPAPAEETAPATDPAAPAMTESVAEEPAQKTE